jgi:ATP-dependent RNA helicase DDX49/DBP8
VLCYRIIRELAFQIADQFSVLGAPLNIRTSTVVGGMDMISQAIELKEKPHVVVASPGRLVDLMKSSYGEIDLSKIKFLVCNCITKHKYLLPSNIAF